MADGISCMRTGGSQKAAEVLAVADLAPPLALGGSLPSSSEQAVLPKPPTQFGKQQPDGTFLFRDAAGAEVRLNRVPGRSAPNTYVVNRGNSDEWMSFDPQSGAFVAGSGVAGDFFRVRWGSAGARCSRPAADVAELSAWLGGGLFQGALQS